jgi:hypothetical protein
MNWYKQGYDVDEGDIYLMNQKENNINVKLNVKMKSKIKHVTGNGSYENQYGAEQPNGKKLLFKHEYTFEDGVTLNASHKTEVCPFKIGDEVEYEVKQDHEVYGKSGSVKKPDSGNGYRGGGKNEDYVKGIEVGHAINNAVNLMCAGVDLEIPESAITTEQKIYYSAKQIMLIAERLKSE